MGQGLFLDVIPLDVKIDLAQPYFNSGASGVMTLNTQDVKKHAAPDLTVTVVNQGEFRVNRQMTMDR